MSCEEAVLPATAEEAPIHSHCLFISVHVWWGVELASVRQFDKEVCIRLQMWSSDVAVLGHFCGHFAIYAAPMFIEFAY